MNTRLLFSGNDAFGEAAIISGCQFYAGYPITPQNELTQYMSRRMLEEGRIFIQSESELASINMVFGASLSGVRAMTSSSSPGISLMQEGISYLAGCELPAVVVNVMRGGPGLGNIDPSQADYFQSTRGGGHGDYRTPVLAPESVPEIFKLTPVAFELADKYRTPVILLGDGMLGQMMEPVDRDLLNIKNKVYPKPWALTGCLKRKPQSIKSLYLATGALEELNLRLQERYRRIEEQEVRFQSQISSKDSLLIVAYGTMARIAKGVIKALKSENINVGLFRPVTLWPFPSKELKNSASGIKNILVLEMSSPQMHEDVRLALPSGFKIDFLGRMGGIIPSEDEIIEKIKKMLKSLRRVK
ncbi:MAG: 3-methyl-2-oxobutanoate dehydrogenase subunit VorB [Candidatus Omnitrophica bacterium]|nr:3-methyl-2-oxobutanoate dehydrogenase subunit VorB [Candidatus Omnitrophota bacterium]